ncbi:hypothetical protein GCM10023206_24430 [Acinetobacter puyangensis]|uniref:Uncharacterized protein n=1 Tax=Acinetobacter puyangensis TaxID=1096779 RepID=A0A240E6E8_9GAMM|nr:hypothetical protein SAMN05421731_101833 [Acinetobacter puyangensis]
MQKNLSKIKIISMILVLSSIGTVQITVAAQQQKVTALPFIAVKMTQQALQNICLSIQITCRDDALALWQLKNDRVVYYLIDNTPQMIKLQKSDGQYKVLDHWNFKDYQHSNQAPIHDYDMASEGLSIYPALYPLNKTEMAIAILNQYFTGYSGGGAHENNADFVKIEAQGKYQVALKDIPFSYSRMIRACFSEQEYKTSPHCHDEEWGILQIEFKDIGQKYYQWTLNFLEYDWSAFEPESHKQVQKSKKVVIPFQQ